MDMKKSVLRLEKIEKRFGDSIVIPNLNLEVFDGEFLCLLGPSGCGKTTSLWMIAGFIPPTYGRIFLHDEEITNLPVHMRDIGIVFQSYALFPHMTIWKNLEFGLINIGIPRDERGERIQRMLKFIELERLGNRFPSELSGGQQQRVALARALILEPSLLLLDEPFSNLDAKLRVRLRRDLKALIDAVSITTIFVTHDREEALSLADRIIVMNQGNVSQAGGPADIYDQPDNAFVADFIGNYTVLKGHVREGVWFSAQGTSLRVGNYADGEWWMAVQPGYLKISFSTTEDANAWKAVVENVEYFGDHYLATLNVDGNIIFSKIHAKGNYSPKIGDSVFVSLSSDDVRFIKPE